MIRRKKARAELEQAALVASERAERMAREVLAGAPLPPKPFESFDEQLKVWHAAGRWRDGSTVL